MQKTNFMTTLKSGILVLLLAIASQGLYAQDFVSAKKGSAIGFSGNPGATDFSASFPKIGKLLIRGFLLMYWKGLTKKLDLSLKI